MSDWVKQALSREYAEGFETAVEPEDFPLGVSEEIVRRISSEKNEPEWLLAWRLEALERWLKMAPPRWADLKLPEIDFSKVKCRAAPKKLLKSLDEVDPKILESFEKLGIPLGERAALAGVAVDAVFDSVSVATTFKKKLEEAGVIFCSMGEAAQKHGTLLREYLGSVVPAQDNFYAALNSAVFSDGSFVLIPKGVKCPMELSTYFRINARNSGQFERTLIIAEEGASVSYLEGCSAPARDENQLHAAVVELVALKGAKIKYSTVQNWYPGDEKGVGGIWNFVTKRADARGDDSEVVWTQVETGSAITWKYPSVILRGKGSRGEFHSIALSNHCQQADTGTKMIHLGEGTKSLIVSKGVSAGAGRNSYRGLVRFGPKAKNARNSTRCDSLLVGARCEANTYPEIESMSKTALAEHEASASRISEEQLDFLARRGLDPAKAAELIVAGFCKEVINKLPMEFAVEAQRLLGVSLEGAVG